MAEKGLELGSRDLESITENKAVNAWIRGFARSPHQLNAPHESDAELIRMPGGEGVLAASVDTLSEEINFGLYDDPYTIGWVVVMANLSDLAAVGAEALGLLLSVSWTGKEDEDFRARVAQGINDACVRMGTHILGGDTSDARSLAFTGCALGLSRGRAALSRRGAAPGHTVYLSHPGGLGNYFVGKKLFGELMPKEQSIEYRPVARLKEGQCLASVASACIDTSDGVLSAIDQLARVNGVGVEIESSWASLVRPECRAVANLPSSIFSAGFHGEYELLFTIPPEREAVFKDLAETLAWTPVRVGTVVDVAGVSHRGRALDTAAFRNLWDRVKPDAASYVRQLLSMCVQVESEGK